MQNLPKPGPDLNGGTSHTVNCRILEDQSAKTPFGALGGMGSMTLTAWCFTFI